MTHARRALSFLTPVGGASAPLPGALAWFPVVGAAIGGMLGLCWWGTTKIWPAPVAAGLVVIGDLVLTGMLHLDGVIDSADGLLPHLERVRRLEVMAEPTVGAYGVLAGVAVLGARWAALSSMHPSIPLMIGLWSASRAMMAAGAVLLAPAHEGSLAAGFLGKGRGPGVRAGILGAVIGVAVLGGSLGREVALGVGVLASIGVLAIGVRRLGGFTGDVLGAAGVVLETTGLLVAAAKW